MNMTSQQDQLEIVSTLAASLADRMLMERMTSGTLPLTNASRLWTASLLLEEHQRPIPGIVEDVLTQFRHADPTDLRAPDRDTGQDPIPRARTGKAGLRGGRLTRLLRPFRQAAAT